MGIKCLRLPSLFRCNLFSFPLNVTIIAFCTISIFRANAPIHLSLKPLNRWIVHKFRRRSIKKIVSKTEVISNLIAFAMVLDFVRCALCVVCTARPMRNECHLNRTERTTNISLTTMTWCNIIVSNKVLATHANKRREMNRHKNQLK